MKKSVLFLVCILCPMVAYAGATDASKFAEKQYANQIGNPKVSINVKKEHTIEYQQKIGGQKVHAITYGYGDMKAKDEKKKRITYITLLDDECKPFWSFIAPSK